MNRHTTITTDQFQYTVQWLCPDCVNIDWWTGIPAGTIRQWRARGHIPPTIRDVGGRFRANSVFDVAHLLVFAELRKANVDLSLAAKGAAVAANHVVAHCLAMKNSIILMADKALYKDIARDVLKRLDEITAVLEPQLPERAGEFLVGTVDEPHDGLLQFYLYYNGNSLLSYFDEPQPACIVLNVKNVARKLHELSLFALEIEQLNVKDEEPLYGALTPGQEIV